MKTRAILTKAGAEFVTPLSLAALTGEKIFQDLFSLTDEAEMVPYPTFAQRQSGRGSAGALADLMAKMASRLLATSTLPTLHWPTDKRRY